MLLIDGFDGAFIGASLIWRDHQRVRVAVYSGDEMVLHLMKGGMTDEEAVEYIEFNVEGAYMGIDTPVVVWDTDLNDEKETQ